MSSTEALAFAWATYLKFPAAEQLLEAWASEKICEPDAAVIELSEVLGSSIENRQQALLRLAGNITRDDAVNFLLEILESGLKIEEEYDLRQMVRNLDEFGRLAAYETPLPLLPIDEAHAHAVFRYYGLRDFCETDAMSIRGSEAYSAVMEFFRGLKPGSYRH
ncbi:hypothetical protein [Deinococcus marmoris]|uniref:hypothetical protein n=1 Tax=Deinococcus marmoris TaxID=249408 RepID=UPI0012DBF655|nr:hypothetical protein [Deinococcus marmoris]